MNSLPFAVIGGPEIVVIVLVAVILLGVPLLVLLGVASGLSILGADDEELEALRERVAELEAQLADEDGEKAEEQSSEEV